MVIFTASAAWQSVILGSGLAALSVLVALLLTALYLVETLARLKRPSRFPLVISPFELGLPVEEVAFPTRSGRHQVRWWYLSTRGATTTILVCPGYRTRKGQTLSMLLFLWRAGYNVLAFEYYGHGAAVGTRITLGYRERDDFFGALAYAKQREPGTHPGVLAYSMGAAVAILCSAHASEVEALIADSAFATHTSVIHYNVCRTLHLSGSPPLVWLATSITWLGDRLFGWLMGYCSHQVEPAREIACLAPRPLLLIHGRQDQMVDPQDVQILATSAGISTELWIVPEADHCGAYFADRAAYIKRVLTFFATHLPMPCQEFQKSPHELAFATAHEKGFFQRSDTSTQTARTRRGEPLC